MYIKTSNFSFLDLAILDLSYSTFTINWDGWNQVKMAKNLKVLNLTGCDNLVKTPDFSSHPLLERLILKGYSTLVEIDKSIGMLKYLDHLNLDGCFGLRKLPAELGCMESLTELLIDETNIVEIPRLHSVVKLERFITHCESMKDCSSLINLTSLKELRLMNSQITFVPDSIRQLVHLVELHIVECHFLKKLPESIGCLVSLSHLDISKSGIEKLPDSIGCLRNLKELIMCNTPIREFPSTIGMTKKLVEIDAEGCRLLRSDLSMLPKSLISLHLPFEIMDAVPGPDISNLVDLQVFAIDLDAWASIESLGPSWIERPRRAPKESLGPCWIERSRRAPKESLGPWWIGRLNQVRWLDLAFPWITTLHPDLGALAGLYNLRLIGLVHLQSIPMLPSNLMSLEFAYCESLETTISDLSYLKKLWSIKISKAPLIKLEGLDSLESLTYLTLGGCIISTIHELPKNLTSLTISNCENLERVPQMSQYKKLAYFNLIECHNIVQIHGRLESLRTLLIKGCKSLKQIPDVLNVKSLTYFQIKSCPKLCHESKITHRNPILTDSSPESEYEWSFMRNMLKICGYSQDIAFGNEEVKGRGKGKRKRIEE